MPLRTEIASKSLTSKHDRYRESMKLFKFGQAPTASDATRVAAYKVKPGKSQNIDYGPGIIIDEIKR